MALELVTGYQGAAHVTAAQDADLQRGIVGETGILNVGNQMAVEIVSANQISISDGVYIADGREFYIECGDSVSVDIETGTQSKERYDIVVVQYSKDSSTGVESCKFVVITGTASTSPVDPDYTDNDIREGAFTSQKPFCRVRLNGLTIEGIDMLVDVLPTLEETVISATVRKIIEVSSLPDDPEEGVMYVITD